MKGPNEALQARFVNVLFQHTRAIAATLISMVFLHLPGNVARTIVGGAIVFAVCTQLGYANDASSGDESLESVEQEIQSTAARLEQLDAEIAQSRALKAKLDKALKVSNERVSEREARIAGLKADVKKYNAQLDKLDAQIAAEQQNVEKRKKVLAESIRRAQRVTSGQGLKVVLQNDNPADADRLSVYTAYFMRAQQRAIVEQYAVLKKIDEARHEALKNRNWLNHIKNKASSQYDSYKTEQAKKKRSIGEVETQITSKTRTVAQLKLDQARLQALMEELRAAQVARSGYFISGQGKYALPVAGTITARFGEVKSVGKLRWEGYFIEAGKGSPVRAIADGAVMYSDWLQGFGMLVILDHGDGYMTLYGGNREVAVKQEDWVESGATIATVGDSGGQKTSGVYFEIRHNAKPVDPKEWVSAKNRIKSAKK